jgi:DNA excision repair protein ERCC-8
MNSFLLNRQLGSISPQALAKAQNQRLLQSLQSADSVTFARRTVDDGSSEYAGIAHAAGVSSIAIDRFEGR